MTTRTLTVLGIEASIEVPYAEGHTLNGQEANALNQVYAENVGNNMRREVKDLQEKEASPKEIVDAILGYASRYHFGMTSSRTTDPVEKQSRVLARDILRRELSKQDRNIDDLTKEERASEISRIANMDKVRRLATKQVKDLEALGDLA